MAVSAKYSHQLACSHASSHARRHNLKHGLDSWRRSVAAVIMPELCCGTVLQGEKNILPFAPC